MSDVPKRPPRTSRPRSSGECLRDGQAKDHSLSPQPKERRAVTMHIELLPSEKPEGGKGSGCAAASSGLDSKRIFDVQSRSDSHVQGSVDQLEVSTSQTNSEQSDNSVTVGCLSAGEVSMRHSKKTGQAPFAPPDELLPVAEPPKSLSTECDVEVSKKSPTSCDEEKHVELRKECVVEVNSSRSPSHPAASIAAEFSLPTTKPALKPKPSIRSLRDVSPKKEELVANQLTQVDPVVSCQSVSRSCVEVDDKPLEQISTGVPIPIYAVVDKSRKQSGKASVRDSDSIILGNPDGTTKLDHMVNAESTELHRNNAPPKKPPRTFAHSEYMRSKSATLPPSTSRGYTISCDYEEIESVHQQMAELIKSNASENESEVDCYGVETSNAGGVARRRQTNDKLPAPPRPPPPAFPDSKRTSIVSSHVIPEEGDSDDENKLLRNSHIRNSDRSGAFERRKPGRSMSMQERRQCDKPKFEGEGKFARANEGDDFYATPVKSADVPDTAKKVNSFSYESRIPDKLPSENQIDSPRLKTRARIRDAYSILRLNTMMVCETDYVNEITEASESSADSSEAELHERLMNHVADIRRQTQRTVLQNLMTRSEQTCHMFQFALIIKLKVDVESNVCKPFAVFQCPDEGCATTDSVLQFCFPDAACWRPVSVYLGETFTFVLTGSDGSRRFGYCRRYLPPGSGNRLPEALCIVSHISEVILYTQLLKAVEDRLQVQGTDSVVAAHNLLRSVYELACPMPNCEVTITNCTPDHKKSLILRRAGENHPDNVSFESLLSTISEETLVQIFASLLLERRIVFCAQKLSTLTSCIHSIISLLYPFEWQHLFVPVLPSSMISVLDATIPFVFGILSSTYAQLLRDCHTFTEILVVDLDGGKFLNQYGDEEQIMPQKLRKALIASLKDDTDSIGVRDIAVTETFLRFFIETCGHYTDYICTQQDGQAIFERDLFVKAVSSRSIQMLLEWFTVTQMFDVFTTEELQGCKHAVFESRILEYREEMASEPMSSLRHNVKLVSKKIKGFFAESGGKIRKKWQHRNVFI